MMRRALFLALLAIVLAGGGFLGAIALPRVLFNMGQEKAVQFQTIEWGGAIGIDQPRKVAINDQAIWSSLWNEAFCNAYNCPPTPTVDFASTTIIAVFSGAKPSLGYLANITRVGETASSVNVHVINTVPEPTCNVGLIVTYPSHVVAIPKTEAAPVFFEETVYGKC